MHALLKAAYAVLLLVAILGAMSTAFSIVELYMVLAGYVQPGEPMYLDQIAPNTKSASLTLLVSLVAIGLALLGCWRTRRWLSSNAS